MAAKVLLVDDDRALQELIKMSLEIEGHEVTVASNGKLAMADIEASPFDLIILDLIMPVMDGVCFIRWLRKERGNEVPVLIMSGASRDGMAQELKSNGATEVVRKPVDITTLLGQVNDLL